MEEFMLRKIVCLLLVFSVFAGVLSAGGGSQAQAPGKVALPSTPAGTPITYPVTGNPKLTYARIADQDIVPAGFSSYNDTPGSKALMKQTGINVEFIELVDQTAFLLYLAGGNLPDIIQGGKTFYPGGIPKMNDDGLAQELTEYLPHYAPDYWKKISSSPLYMNAIREPDGKHYAFAGYFLEIGSPYASWSGLVARKEILDRLNMQPPETVDEVYQYLVRSKNDLGIENPFMSDRSRFPYLFDNGALTAGFRLPRAAAYQIDGKVHFGAFEPAYRDVLAFFNKLYTEKLLDNNFAVTDEATAHSSVLSGKTSLIVTAASRIQSMTYAANNAPDFTLLGLPTPTHQKGVKPMFSQIDDPVTYSFWCYMPNTCRDLVNSLKLLNYLHTTNGSTLANFGEEGVTFNWANSQPIYTDFVTKNPAGMSLDSILRAYALLNFPITQDPRMSRQRFPLQQQLQAMDVWSASDADKYKIVNGSIPAQYADEYASLITDITTYINESRAQFISGALPISQFDAYIANLRSMGMDRMMQILQASYEIYNK